ncbi:MAG TPA: ImmA/IrrE family metallo-endopeptidase [Pyrinomonadaceae bacterium]|nr:ImmA/IrrE family metallo-endopeptidase [Pyrinomonadaceae bacterium]
MIKDFPPTEKGRRYEMRAQGLRQFAGLKKDTDRLDPFELAAHANLLVVPFEQVAALSSGAREHLIGAGKDAWSGGAASIPLPDGRTLIILNPTHNKNRHAATLMEEVSHVFLGHKANELAVKDPAGKTTKTRDYNHAIEEEAYSTGAAALVPYSGLKKLIVEGRTVREIARHFAVSSALVEFRIKISRLWDIYEKHLFNG